MTNLFQSGQFVLNSALTSSWKIECDALTDADVATIAAMMIDTILWRFSRVEGVPRGGLRLAEALRKYQSPDGGLLIVDDVLTTGGSMERQRRGRKAQGAVIFARQKTEGWVTPLFQMTTSRRHS